MQLVWVETPTNPTLKVSGRRLKMNQLFTNIVLQNFTLKMVDIAAVAEIVHKRENILLVVDNTFLSSYFQVNIVSNYFGSVISNFLFSARWNLELI